jgi:hypothetical protein
MMLADYGSFEAMVNYEALVIEANRELVRRGQEPLYVIYPVDGIMTADSPLAYVNKGDAAKEALFGELQKYLLSEAAQQAILALGPSHSGARLRWEPGGSLGLQPRLGASTYSA